MQEIVVVFYHRASSLLRQLLLSALLDVEQVVLCFIDFGRTSGNSDTEEVRIFMRKDS